MARNIKTGLAYYNLETDRFSDLKVKRLIHAFSVSGIAIYDFILNEIYRDKGCFIVWDESTAFNVADVLKVKENTVTEVVNYCCTVGLFNKELFTSERALTSLSIQKRYITVCRLCKRKDVFIPDNLKLFHEESAKPPDEIGKTQEEVHKESKEKKEKERIGSSAPDEKIDMSNSNLFRKPVVPEKQKVQEVFLNAGGTAEMADTFFNKYDSIGWFLNGSPIKSFASLVPNFITNWKKNDIDRKTGQNNTHRATITGTAAGAGTL